MCQSNKQKRKAYQKFKKKFRGSLEGENGNGSLNITPLPYSGTYIVNNR
jgi:hypothetical protein